MNNLFRWLTVLLMLFLTSLLIENSKAGIDFAMTGKEASREFYKGYELPDFSTGRQALDWVKTVGYVEPLRRLLSRKVKDLDHDTQKYWYYKTALDLMEDMKKNNVGATWIASVETVK